jgi:hypothetical protein
MGVVFDEEDLASLVRPEPRAEEAEEAPDLEEVKPNAKIRCNASGVSSSSDLKSPFISC